MFWIWCVFPSAEEQGSRGVESSLGAAGLRLPQPGPEEPTEPGPCVPAESSGCWKRIVLPALRGVLWTWAPQWAPTGIEGEPPGRRFFWESLVGNFESSSDPSH